MALIKRGDRDLEPADVFGRVERMFDDWTRGWPFFGGESRSWAGHDTIRVDEYHEGSELVIQAELPGVDPDKDVKIIVGDGMLRITARGRTEEEDEGRDYVRRELRYGSFARTLPLPDGVTESDVKASYKDGVLEVRVAIPYAPVTDEPKQIPVKRG